MYVSSLLALSWFIGIFAHKELWNDSIFSLIPSFLSCRLFQTEGFFYPPICRLHQPAARKQQQLYTSTGHCGPKRLSARHTNTCTHVGTKQVTIYACHEFAEGGTGVCVCACVLGWMCVLVHLMFPALSEAILSMTQIFWHKHRSKDSQTITKL